MARTGVARGKMPSFHSFVGVIGRRKLCALTPYVRKSRHLGSAARRSSISASSFAENTVVIYGGVPMELGEKEHFLATTSAPKCQDYKYITCRHQQNFGGPNNRWHQEEIQLLTVC